MDARTRSDDKPMIRRPFGDTGLTLTPLGLGLAALGRPGYINLGHASDLHDQYEPEVMELRAHEMLDQAWELGIRYFDAARSYGLAERFLSTWLQSRDIDSSEVVVGSKWGYTYTAEWQIQADAHEVKTHDLPTFRRQLRESRALLSNHMKIYQVHSATVESGVLSSREVLGGMAALRDSGMIIGLSLSGPGQVDTLRKALSISIEGAPLFRSVQATWNLLARGVEPALKEAHSAGMGVILKEVLANGRLTSRNTEAALAAKLDLLRSVAAECRTSMESLAVAAAIRQPWVDVVLSGAATQEHLRENVAALEVSWDPGIAQALEVLQEPEEQYWLTRSQLAWN